MSSNSNKLIPLPNLNIPKDAGETLMDSTVSLESAIARLWHCRTLFSPAIQHAIHQNPHLLPQALPDLLKDWLVFTRSLLWLREETFNNAPRMKAIQLALALDGQHHKLADIQNGLKRTNTAALNSIEDMMVLLVSVARCTSFEVMDSSQWLPLLQPITIILRQSDSILQSIITSGHWFATLAPPDFSSSAKQNLGMPEPHQIQRLLSTIQTADRHLAKMYALQVNSASKRRTLMERLKSMCSYMIALQEPTARTSRDPSKPWLNGAKGAHLPLNRFVK